MTGKKLKEQAAEIQAAIPPEYSGTNVPPQLISGTIIGENPKKTAKSGRNAAKPHTKIAGFNGDR